MHSSLVSQVPRYRCCDAYNLALSAYTLPSSLPM